MPTMTGGQALMRSLYLEGVRVIFGLPGVQLYHALDALNDVPGIRFITTRHEQATTYMADGYARAGGGRGHRADGTRSRIAERVRRAEHGLLSVVSGAGGLRPDRTRPDWHGPRDAA